MKFNDPLVSVFNETEVRNALTFAMKMGMPEKESERVVFKWDPVVEYDVPTDKAGVPFDLDAEPTKVTQKPDVAVPVVVQRKGDSVDGTPMGPIVTADALLTLLDVDYEQVADADHVRIGNETYNIVYTEPSIGLFGLTVYMIHLESENES